MTAAPKIDTTAPERIWAFQEGMTWKYNFWQAQPHHRADEYIRADLAAAQTAAAWIAGRDALANHISAMMTRCAEANDKTYPSYAEDMRDWATDVTNEAGDLHPPADASAALDRLIADRVREAVDRALRDAVAICKKVRNENAENEDQAVGALDCAVSIMDEVNRRARGSKEGRDG